MEHNDNDKKQKVEEIKESIKESKKELEEIQGNCKHEKQEVTLVSIESEAKKEARIICSVCEKILRYPTNEELKENGYI